MREIILDTETTGLDPRSGDRLVEIGCVELVNRFPTGATWHEYINPERSMPEAAFKVHGLGDEFLSDKPVFANVADAFLDFIGDATLVIHNAPFDMGFINHELGALGRIPIGSERVVDTLAIAKRKHPGAQNNLDALCRRYRIDNGSRTLHGALLDAQLLAEVYLELIGAQQGALDLAASAKRTSAVRGVTKVRVRPVPLAPRLSDEEEAAHRAFVEQLGAHALWFERGLLARPVEKD